MTSLQSSFFPICTLDLWLEESVVGYISFTLQFIMLTIFVFLSCVLVLKKTVGGVFLEVNSDKYSHLENNEKVASVEP